MKAPARTCAGILRDRGSVTPREQRKLVLIQVKESPHPHLSGKDRKAHLSDSQSIYALNHLHTPSPCTHRTMPGTLTFRSLPPLSSGHYYHLHEIEAVGSRGGQDQRQRQGTNPHLPRSPLGSRGTQEFMAVTIYDGQEDKASGRADGLPGWENTDTAGQKREGLVTERGRRTQQ